jgi:hypothetical protein
MILYSITINIEKETQKEWLIWMQNIHIPSILKTGLIIENKILRLLNETEESSGVTYSFQFLLKDLASLEKYQREFEPAIDAELYNKFRNRFVEFRTVLEVLNKDE